MSKVDEFLKTVRVVIAGREPGMIQQKMLDQAGTSGGGKTGQKKTNLTSPLEEAEAHAHWIKTGKGV